MGSSYTVQQYSVTRESKCAEYVDTLPPWACGNAGREYATIDESRGAKEVLISTLKK